QEGNTVNGDVIAQAEEVAAFDPGPRVFLRAEDHASRPNRPPAELASLPEDAVEVREESGLAGLVLGSQGGDLSRGEQSLPEPTLPGFWALQLAQRDGVENDSPLGGRLLRGNHFGGEGSVLGSLLVRVGRPRRRASV